MLGWLGHQPAQHMLCIRAGFGAKFCEKANINSDGNLMFSRHVTKYTVSTAASNIWG